MICDHCGALMHVDGAGWWVGENETSDCPDNADGHQVDGNARGSEHPS